jgi:Tfp pilus assembly protein PilO
VAVVNAVLLLVHPGRTGAGFAEMQKDLDAETEVLAALVEKERTVKTVLADARASSEALDELYLNRFSTEAERLTRLISEVKRLAKRAGLEPSSISYPVETIDDYGLVRMSLVFGVTGTYPQLRTLVNLLELSDLFLVLERVGLSNSASSTLGMSLQISTFFVREPETGEDARAARVSRSSAVRPAAEPPTERSSAEPSMDPSGVETSNGEIPSSELWPDEPSAAEPASDESEEP